VIDPYLRRWGWGDPAGVLDRPGGGGGALARRADPSLEPHFDRGQTREPILVKNIENVQGDERDVIIFSVAVGPDKSGRITAQISSLNTEGGHRRLNVAVTRARRELLVFATLRPEQIETGRGTESPFEDAVMRALQNKGWVVDPQVGVSFFRIDLGVVHPDFPGRYLAGVECDGAAYHRSATARDRDRLREMVLSELGWRIRRIWSTEWWMDAASATEKLHTQLTGDLEADRASWATQPAAPEKETPEPAAIDLPQDEGAPEPKIVAPMESPPAVATTSPPVTPPQPANDYQVEEIRKYARGPNGLSPVALDVTYVKADPAEIAKPDRDRFYDISYRGELRTMVEYVIEVEGPIYFDVLVERIARAHGFQRSGEIVQKTVAAALGRNRFPNSRDGDREILWPQDVTIVAKAAYRGAGDRDHGDIPLPELAGLASILRAHGLEDQEEIIRGMQEHFGLGRLAASTRERFRAATMLALI
jgi:REase_MTES_1575/Protein of unknown function (DUF3320)/AAA domain